MTPANLSLLNTSALWRDLAPALANHLWQSTLFAIAVGLLTFLLRKNHAQARYWLWLTASVKFLIPFSLLVNLGSLLAWSHAAPAPTGSLYVAVEAISQPFSEPAIVNPSIAQVAPASAAPSLLHWLPVLMVAAWLCGFAVVLLVWCLRWRRISAALRESAHRCWREPELQALRRLERTWRARGGRFRTLSCRAFLLEPGIFGITRPVLIWPEGNLKTPGGCSPGSDSRPRSLPRAPPRQSGGRDSHGRGSPLLVPPAGLVVGRRACSKARARLRRSSRGDGRRTQGLCREHFESL